MRWRWIDTFLEFKHGKSARAVKNLSLAEDFFDQHFPGYPVFPAALILEGLAQTGGILVGEANEFHENVVLAKVSSARFFREVLAGEQLVYDVDIAVLRKEGASVHCRVSARDSLSGPEADETAEELVAEADIFFGHLPRERAKEMLGQENFTFSSELRLVFGLQKLMEEDVQAQEETESTDVSSAEKSS